jgi:hypothetical protein
MVTVERANKAEQHRRFSDLKRPSIHAACYAWSISVSFFENEYTALCIIRSHSCVSSQGQRRFSTRVFPHVFVDIVGVGEVVLDNDFDR